MSRFPLRVGQALLAACALLGAPAGAATISGLTYSNGSSTAFDNTGAVRSVAQSSLSTPISGTLGFQVRYGAVVGADAEGPGSASRTETLNGSFTITFSITEANGVAWTANVDVLRNGAQTIISDGNGRATVTLGALSVAHSGAGTLVGSLGLGAVGTLSNNAAPATSPNQAFNQSASTTLTGVGTGAAQVVTLVFTFTATATTTVQGNNGDEAAVRMGLDSALGAFTADNYPGATPRTIANDGIFASVSVPEPAAEALLALGLIGLGWFEYSRRP